MNPEFIKKPVTVDLLSTLLDLSNRDHRLKASMVLFDCSGNANDLRQEILEFPELKIAILREDNYG